MNRIKALCLAAAAGTMGLSGQAARADTVLSIDLNDFTATVTAAGAGRSIALAHDGNTVIGEIKYLGGPPGPSYAVDSFSGSMSVSGTTVGSAVTGSFILKVPDLVTGLDTYSVVSLSGTVTGISTLLNQVSVEATTSGGMFATGTDTKFGPTDVSPFVAVQPVGGTIFQFDLDANDFLLTGGADGFDATVDAEITAVVPVPAAVWGGLALMGAIGTSQIRKRRKEEAL